MRICFILSEIFSWGKYGGYGSIARSIAGGLAQRGIDVHAILPLRKGQKRLEVLDGVKVHGVPAWELFSPAIYRQVGADIYHSQEASILSMMAMIAMPDRKHILTSIDPWDWKDWFLEFKYDVRSSPKRGLIYPLLYLFYSSPLIRFTGSRMRQVYCQAQYLAEKTQKYFALTAPPDFLPNPYRAPEPSPNKADKPTVCYLARWDARKRPQIFFELARLFPQVRFIAVGRAHDPRLDLELRDQYGGVPNLEMTGFIHAFESPRIRKILDESWILVNTAAREGLPAAYVESASHACAILTSVDSDGFASRGGYHVQHENGIDLPTALGGWNTTLDDYAAGLEWLLHNDRWRVMGQEGRSYVLAVHEHGKVMEQHLTIYNELLRS
jgi:glycosyltransferase involved in cell wall biosynthesis